MIINYDALRNPERFNLIKQLILDNDDLLVVLDESHKIKGKEISKIMHQLCYYFKKVNFNWDTNATGC